MNKNSIRKVLIIISILIIGLGIILGIIFSRETIDELSYTADNTFVVEGYDSSDFSKVVKTIDGISSSIAGLVVVILSIGIALMTWIIYGITLLIVKVINKIKNHRE